MYKKLLIVSLLALSVTVGRSQDPESGRKGIHEIENDHYSLKFIDSLPPDDKGKAFPSALLIRESATPSRMVLGWHPYWASANAHQSYDYSVLTHIAYFSYEVDTATGGYVTIRGWNTTPIIDYAHQKGTKVLLTVTNFGSLSNTKLLSDTAKQNVLINNLITLLKSRNGDGVNFDLESVSISQKVNLVNFISKATQMIRSELPSAEISMACPAVDWSGSWDLRNLAELCDYLIVMGYDYYWSGSSTAGPVAPLYGENYNVSRSISTYLDAGVPAGKLYLGVPWYGYDWPVESQLRKSATTGKATARTFSVAQQLTETYNNEVFDQITRTPWLSYSVATSWRQLWYEDTTSLAAKYSYVNSRNLAGIGIWALSYEGSHYEIWSTLSHAFSLNVSYDNSIINLYPNPVQGTSKIEFALSAAARVTLKICDLTGRNRIILVDEDREQGFYSEEFNSVDLESGIYCCILRTGNKTSTRKFIIIN